MAMANSHLVGVGRRWRIITVGHDGMRFWERLRSLFGFSYLPQTRGAELARPTATPKKGDVRCSGLERCSISAAKSANALIRASSHSLGTASGSVRTPSKGPKRNNPAICVSSQRGEGGNGRRLIGLAPRLKRCPFMHGTEGGATSRSPLPDPKRKPFPSELTNAHLLRSYDSRMSTRC